jgi:hypothetical protein
VRSDEFRYLATSVTVEDTEECDLMIGDIEICDVGIFHILPPALHLAGGVFELFVFLPVGAFDSDGFV